MAALQKLRVRGGDQSLIGCAHLAMLKSGCMWSGCTIRQSDGTCSLNRSTGRPALIIIERGGGCAEELRVRGEIRADRLRSLGHVEVRRLRGPDQRFGTIAGCQTLMVLAQKLNGPKSTSRISVLGKLLFSIPSPMPLLLSSIASTISLSFTLTASPCRPTLSS